MEESAFASDFVEIAIASCKQPAKRRHGSLRTSVVILSYLEEVKGVWRGSKEYWQSCEKGVVKVGSSVVKQSVVACAWQSRARRETETTLYHSGTATPP